MTEEIVTRWFRGEGSEGVFGIYRAKFQGSTYLSEEYWYLKTATEWSPNTRVRDWYFIGNDRIWETTEEDAKSYLPPEAL
jgi:hypothetical protein